MFHMTKNQYPDWWEEFAGSNSTAELKEQMQVYAQNYVSILGDIHSIEVVQNAIKNANTENDENPLKSDNVFYQVNDTVCHAQCETTFKNAKFGQKSKIKKFPANPNF